MRPNSWQDREWRISTAAICGFAALFVTAILMTRLSITPQPLSAWWTMATALVVGGLCASSIELGARESSITRLGRTAGALAGSGVTSFAILATTRQANPAQVAFACVLCVLFASTAIIWALRSELEAESAQQEITGRCASRSDNSPNNSTHVAASTTDRRDADSGLPDHVDQTLRRYIADRRDHLEACVRVRFQAGQQTSIVHLPIQPPMSLEPEVECEPVDDADLRITVDPAQPYGVRLVCRRSGPWTEAAESVVAVLVTADTLANAAA
ncbi:MAG TPA: hypothetical protein VM510_06190 [Caulifigura sp.]|nr:hypothetical protein [Caulifigura sp.]